VITACSTFDTSGHEFKALIVEYMPNGSLEGWLYPKLNKYGLKRPLSLSCRITSNGHSFCFGLPTQSLFAPCDPL